MISHILNSMIGYFGTDIRRINHALKVYGFACAIMKDEKLDSREALVVPDYPEWAHGAVFYQIYPQTFDRDVKGDVLNFLNNYLKQYEEIKGKGFACIPIGNHDLSSAKINIEDRKLLAGWEISINRHENRISLEIPGQTYSVYLCRIQKSICEKNKEDDQ